MTPTVNLESCRRCGQREGEVSANDGWFMVECQNCPQRTSNSHRSAEGAIAEWNRRPPTDNLEAGAGDLVEVAWRWKIRTKEEWFYGAHYPVGADTIEPLYSAAQLAAVTAENARLREALEFYADPRSYHGPNQRADEGEKHTVGSYRKDVTRDGGDIARAALSQEAPK